MLPATDDGGIEWDTGIGAGPYRIVDNEPGVGASLERHDGWHREGAWFDGIEITILNDPNARQTSLITDDVDAISSVDLKTLTLLGRHPDIEIDNVPSGSAITLPMFCDHAPYDNVDVRLALKYAIDREEIVEKILFGTGTPGNDFHVSPNMPYWPDIEQRVYDPDKAKHHLKQAGMESLRVELSAADSVLPGAVDMVVLYSEQAKAAGIDLVPRAGAQRRLLVGRVAEEALRVRQVGCASDAGQHVHARLQGRRSVERGALAECTVQRTPADGEGGARRDAARRDVPRDVPDRPATTAAPSSRSS